MHALMAELFPICRSITGDGVRETLRRDRASGSRSRCTRCRAARRCSTGPSRTSGTSATPTSRADGRAGRRLPAVEPPRRQLQRAGPRDDAARRAAAAPAHARRAAGLDPVPHVVLHADVGLLPRAGRSSTRSRTASTRSSIDSTLEPGLAHVRRVRPARRARRRGPPDDARLPPVARERQPLRDRAADGARGGARERAATVLLPPPLHPGHDRLDHVARAQRGPARPRIVGGLVVACVGDGAPLTYKRSRRGDARIDRAAEHVLSRS